MQAIEITSPGGPEVLKPVVRPQPSPMPDQVLIRVHAAGVNRPDCLQRMGLYPVPPGASDLPGLEVAGEIVAVGDDVERWRIGDHVCALTHGGGYAQYCVAHAWHCLPVPDGMSMAHAAAIPETAFTVYSNVWMRCAIQPGESLLVHGGSSGIGSTAIQMAKAKGHTVVVTAGSEEKCNFCKQLGADIAINYRDVNWRDALEQAMPDGIDVILDMVGGSYVQPNLDSLKPDGRYALIALIGGAVVQELNIAGILRKRLTFLGSTLRPQTDLAKAAIAKQLEQDIWPLLSIGAVVPMIYETFALADAAKAHALMESGDMMGKLVLTTSDD